MKKRSYRIFPLLLALLVAAGCTQNNPQKSPEPAPAPPPVSAPALPEAPIKAEWPADLAPAELPAYTAGAVTASAVDGEGVLTIKVESTSASDLQDYLGRLQSAGWIVTSSGTEAEAVLGLHEVRFQLQREGTLLQIDVYTREAGSWPSEQIPTDILEPDGTLVGWWSIGSGEEKKTYYFAKDGLMVSGRWVQIGGRWYYFYADGTLARHTVIDGYEVDESGGRKAK